MLGEHGAFPQDFVGVLKTVAKFGNRLMHLYWEVDDNQVYEILQTQSDDFKKFMDCIAGCQGLERKETA